MIGFGAIVKSVVRAFDVAVSAASSALRLAPIDRRSKLCPVPIPVDARRRRR